MAHNTKIRQTGTLHQEQGRFVSIMSKEYSSQFSKDSYWDRHGEQRCTVKRGRGRQNY